MTVKLETFCCPSHNRLLLWLVSTDKDTSVLQHRALPDALGVGLGACGAYLDALAGRRAVSEFNSSARRRNVKLRVPEIVRGVHLT